MAVTQRGKSGRNSGENRRISEEFQAKLDLKHQTSSYGKMSKYVKYAKVKEVYDVSSTTVRRWAIEGVIGHKVVQGRTYKLWFYDLDSIGRHINSKFSSGSQMDPLMNMYNRISLLQEKYLEELFDILRSSVEPLRGEVNWIDSKGLNLKE